MTAWVPLAMMALSIAQEKQKANQMKRHNLGQAALTKYSPWTGMAGKVSPYSPNYAGAAIGSGLAGYEQMRLMDEHSREEAERKGRELTELDGEDMESVMPGDGVNVPGVGGGGVTPAGMEQRQHRSPANVQPQIYQGDPGVNAARDKILEKGDVTSGVNTSTYRPDPYSSRTLTEMNGRATTGGIPMARPEPDSESLIDATFLDRAIRDPNSLSPAEKRLWRRMQMMQEMKARSQSGS